MGDTSLAQDILDGVQDAMADDVGHPIIIREIQEGALTPGDPGAGRVKVVVDHQTNGIVSAYDANRIDGTTIKKGDMEGIVSIAELSIRIEPGMRFINGAIDYEIVTVEIPEVAGIDVTAIVQLRE